MAEEAKKEVVWRKKQTVDGHTVSYEHVTYFGTDVLALSSSTNREGYRIPGEWWMFFRDEDGTDLDYGSIFAYSLDDAKAQAIERATAARSRLPIHTEYYLKQKELERVTRELEKLKPKYLKWKKEQKSNFEKVMNRSAL